MEKAPNIMVYEPNIMSFTPHIIKRALNIKTEALSIMKYIPYIIEKSTISNSGVPYLINNRGGSLRMFWAREKLECLIWKLDSYPCTSWRRA